MAIFGIKNPFTREIDNSKIEEAVKKVLANPENKEAKENLGKMAKSSKKKAVAIVSTIMRYQYEAYRKTIAVWQQAKAEASDVIDPRKYLINEFYKDLESDPFIYGMTWYKRILKISNKKGKVVGVDGKENLEETKLLSDAWFNDFVKHAMHSIFHGHSLVNFNEWNEKGRIKKVTLIYREHVIPEKHCFVIQPYDIVGIDYTLPPYDTCVIGIGRDNDLGLFEKIAQYYVLKKFAFASWNEFTERFGVPILTAKTASQDKKVLDKIEGWLRDLSTGAYGIFPIDSNIEVTETGNTDAFEVFYQMIKACREEIEVALTGQMRTTRQNGTYGKEVAELDEANELIEDDKTYIANIINNQLIPMLRANGYPIAEESRFEWNDGKQATPKERLEIFQGVKNLGYKVDIKQVSEELDVRITEDDGETDEIEENDDLPKPDDKPKKKTGKGPDNSWIKDMHEDINKQLFHVQ